MVTLNLVPRGEVTKNYNFNNNKVDFESGITQIQRKWISPRITFTFNVMGDKAMKEYLESFFAARGGNYEAFFWAYEGTTYRVRFNEPSLDFTEIRGYSGEGTVGYKAQVSLMVLKDAEE
jgi:phage-related protein